MDHFLELRGGLYLLRYAFEATQVNGSASNNTLLPVMNGGGSTLRFLYFEYFEECRSRHGSEYTKCVFSQTIAPALPQAARSFHRLCKKMMKLREHSMPARAQRASSDGGKPAYRSRLASSASSARSRNSLKNVDD
jgi:hypothetical protein